MSSGYGNVPFDQLIPPPDHAINTHRDVSVGIGIIFLGVIATLTVCARLFQRWSSKNLGLDDYAVIPAVVLHLAWTAVAAFYNFNSGFGKPVGEITFGEFVVFFKGIFVAAWMYPITSASVRISVLLFYRRIFGRTSTFNIVTIWVLLGLQGAYIIVFEIIPGFSCHPISAAWNLNTRYTQCSDLFVFETDALYSVSLAFDVILLVFPIRSVWKLQMPLRKRLGVIVIFVLGASASVVSAVRLGIYVYEGSHFEPSDPSWWNYQASFYIFPQYSVYGKNYWLPTQLEAAVGLIGTSLPALMHLSSAVSLQFSRIRSTLTGTRRETDNSHRTDYSGRSARSRSAKVVANTGKFQEIGSSEVELHNVSTKSSLRRDTNTVVT